MCLCVCVCERERVSLFLSLSLARSLSLSLSLSLALSLSLFPSLSPTHTYSLAHTRTQTHNTHTHTQTHTNTHTHTRTCTHLPCSSGSFPAYATTMFIAPSHLYRHTLCARAIQLIHIRDRIHDTSTCVIRFGNIFSILLTKLLGHTHSTTCSVILCSCAPQYVQDCLRRGLCSKSGAHLRKYGDYCSFRSLLAIVAQQNTVSLSIDVYSCCIKIHTHTVHRPSSGAPFASPLLLMTPTSD